MSGSLLFTGPPASGKSRAALARFLDTPDSLLVLPTATSAEHARHELARAGVAVRPSQVTTLARFIDNRADQPKPSPQLLDHLIRAAIRRTRIERFRAVADFPGFHRALASLIEEIPPASAGDDLGPIFADIRRELDARGYALRDERLRSAARNPSPLPPQIIFDGFFSFAEAELEMLEHLSARTTLAVTLPSSPAAEPARERLLQANFEPRVCSHASQPAPANTFAAPTLDREVEEIARLILKEAAAGRPFREIGILLRSREPYLAALETTLARFGIPARFYFADPLDQHPAIECISRIIDSQLSGWDHALLLAALRMPVLGIGATPEGDKFDFEIRAKIPGRGLPLRGIEHPILGTLAAKDWRDPAEPRAWAARLKTLRELFPLSASESQIRSTSAALDAFAAVLDETAAILAGPMPLADFWKEARAGLTLETLRIPDRRRNAVYVMDIFEARQWRLPVVFVCGMTERHFPQYHRENPLFGDAARLRAGLRTSADLQRDETFLFEIATTRAAEKTILSYARFNEKGDDSLPSFFLSSEKPQFVAARIQPRPMYAARADSRPAIRSDAAIARLGELHRKLAPTSIEAFLQCPFQFYAGKTLRLAPRPSAPRDRLDARVQGSILHRALAELGKTPLLGSEVLDQVFEDECRHFHVPAGYRREAVRLEITRNFEAFLRDRTVDLGWATRAEQEFQFALSPLLSIRGRIDRLEIGPANLALVIDYKYSGQQKVRELVENHQSGDAVQGGLYLAAARRVFNLEPAGMLYCGLRKDVVWNGWHASIPGLEQVGERRSPDGIQDLIASAEAKAMEVAERIASGQIAPHPADTKKCVWCDFRDACRIESAARTKGAGAP